MSEIHISAKNTFVECSEGSKLGVRRSFSDSQLCGEVEEDTPRIYSIREEKPNLDNIFSNYVENNPDMIMFSPDSQMKAALLSRTNSELTIESHITGKTMSVARRAGHNMATLSSASTVARFSTESDLSYKNPMRIASFPSTPSNASRTPSPDTSPKLSFPSLDASPKVPEDIGDMSLTDRTRLAQLYRDNVSDWCEESEFVDIQEYAVQNPIEDEERTTIMIRNIPCRYIQSELMEEVFEFGYPVNFLYLPPARHNNGNLGYAFVNFVHAADAPPFMEKWNGHTWKFQPHTKKCAASCYATLQGFHANAEYYKKMKISKSRCRPYIDYIVGAKEFKSPKCFEDKSEKIIPV